MAEHDGSDVKFYGVFPNRKSSAEAVANFKEKYGFSFEMIIDTVPKITKKYDALVTPEVIVVNTISETIVYKGRIDDSYYRVGRRRQVSQTSELSDVLSAIRTNSELGVKWEPAIGCVITRR